MISKFTKTFAIISMMMYLISSSYGQSAVSTPDITVTGLSHHQGHYFTLYLVAGSTFIGREPTITKVLKTLWSGKIADNKITVKSMEFNISGAYLPNFFIGVIHRDEEHKLNKHHSPGRIKFEEPLYALEADRPSQRATSSFLVRKSRSYSDEETQVMWKY